MTNYVLLNVDSVRNLVVRELGPELAGLKNSTL